MQDDQDRLSKAFAALADPTRRAIVVRLTRGAAGVQEIAEDYPISLQAVSKHVSVLEEAGLVTRTRQAQRRPVHLEPEVLDLMTAWLERYRRRAEERFSRLDHLLQETGEATGAPPANTRKAGTDR